MNDAMRATVLDFDTLSSGDIDTSPLDRAAPGIVYHPATPPALLMERLAGQQIVVINKVRLDAATIADCPDLGLIALAATGTDNVDLEAAREGGVAVTNIRAYCTASVVQHVFALILGLTQQLKAYEAELKAGAWRESPQFCMLGHPIRELDGKCLGIVGHGELGAAVATAARAFGMEVLVARRVGETDDRPGRLALEEVLEKADVVSLHCPLTAATANLVGAHELDLMKDDALLINTARGGLVDSLALVAALRQGRIGGAGIDVLRREPPVDGDPLLEVDLDNLIVTPHVAWAAREARQRAVEQIALCIRSFIAGERYGRVI
jgi:glycerate dehydrogenase